MSPRPKDHRKIGSRFQIKTFRPIGKPVRLFKKIEMEREEVEALKLVDLLGMNQTKAAKKMGTSQSTLYRILANARKKTAEAIIKGKILKIN
jgi:predicted DNA-binding protein (UPF0251 family)